MKNFPKILFVVLGAAGYWCLQFSRMVSPIITSRQDEKGLVAPALRTHQSHSNSSVVNEADEEKIKTLEDQLERLTSELAKANTKAETEKRLANELRTKVQDLEAAKLDHHPAEGLNEDVREVASLQNSNTSHDWDESNNTSSFSYTGGNGSDICQQIPSSLRAWIDNIGVTLGVSQDRKHDPSYVLRDLNAQALDFITPRLSRATEGLPHRNLDKLLPKARARFEYLTNKRNISGDTETTKTTTIPPPIRIYVSGGSVAHGQGCGTSIQSIGGDRCSWPWRLQVLVNNLVGGNMVEIINRARGGANSQAGRALLAYVPPSQPIDIVINAHSVNDQILVTRDQAAFRNLSLSQYTLDMAQNFTRQVMTHHPDAILLWLEDYLGNDARNLLELQDFSQKIHTLSKYYGFGVLSYTDAVKDVVYGDTHETALTPVWYKDNPPSKNGTKTEPTMVREVHPGVMMHACVTYLWLYYGWNLLREACSGLHNTSSVRSQIPYNATRAEETTFNNNAQWPRPRPEGLPPKLTTSLRLEDISNLWRNSTVETTDGTVVREYSDSGEPSCPFQWTAGIQKYIALASLEEDSQRQFSPYLRSPGTWKFIQSDFGKGRYGWAHYESFVNSSTPQQPITFEFPFPGIQTIAIFVAKNIDPSWKNSTAKVTVRNDHHEIVKTQTIDGYRVSEDSKPPRKRTIRFSMARSVVLDEVDLSEAFSSHPSSTKNFTVEFEHVSGVGFKFMAMALCRFPSILDGLPLSIGN